MEYTVLGLLILSLLLVIMKLINTGDVLNPAVLAGFAFVVPALTSMLRLSALQSESWDGITYLLVVYAICAFVLVPYFFTGNMRAIPRRYELYFNIRAPLILLLFVVSVVLYMLCNKEISGYFLPILSGLNLDEEHVATMSFLSTFTLLISVVTIVFLVCKYMVSRNVMYLIPTAIITVLPVTRLARLDAFIYIILISSLLCDLSKNKKKYILKVAALACGLAILIAAIGEYRTTVGYTFDISYADDIGFVGYAGPFDVLAVMYGYTSLSLENLDRFVRANGGFSDLQLGAYTFRPILVGFFKAHRILDDFPMYEYFYELRDPLVGAATVPTALAEFCIDYGYYLSIFPMVLYSSLGIILYNHSAKYPKYRVCYLVYVPNYLLLSFANNFIQPLWLYLVIFFVLFLSICRTLKEVTCEEARGVAPIKPEHVAYRFMVNTKRQHIGK